MSDIVERQMRRCNAYFDIEGKDIRITIDDLENGGQIGMVVSIDHARRLAYAILHTCRKAEELDTEEDYP